MRYNFDIWNCLCKIMDSFVLVYVPFRLFPLRHLRGNKSIAFFLSLFVLSALTYGADFLFYPVPFQITLVFFVILGIIYVRLLFEGQFHLQTIVLGASISAMMVLRYISGVIVRQFMKEFNVFSLEMTVVSTILLLLLTLFIIHFAVIPKTRFPSKYGISMAAFMIVMALATDVIAKLTFQLNNWSVSFEIFGFSVGVVLFLYFLFFKIVWEFEEKNTIKLVNRQMETQQKHMQESMQAFNEMRFLRHEIKNHVFYMQALLKQKKWDELEDYFNQVYRSEYSIDIIDSGNNTVNAILSQKTAYAKSKGIDISIHSSLPEALPMEESSLCTVLSNLLDNAIEACETLASPSVFMNVQQSGRYIHILCKNTVAYDVCKKNPTMQTTKQTDNHGLGLQIIRTILEKHDGMIDFYMEDMMFVVTLMLKTNAVLP
ncbi:MAG: GHKL domain-containing protein [Oscillospiraceae bacterium]|nr:GHKL domain-containing protein [Oscillospiraceae bacterium]